MEAFTEAFDQGLTLADIRGLEVEDLESLYSIGYGYFVQKRYQEASKFFQLLCFYHHKEPRYWHSLGVCRQALENYQGAYDAYVMEIIEDPFSLRAYLHGATCALGLGRKEDALFGFQKVIELADKTNTLDTKLKEHAKAQVKKISKNN